MPENIVSDSVTKFRAAIARETRQSTLLDIPHESLRVAFLEKNAKAVRDALAKLSDLQFGVGPLSVQATDVSRIDLIVSMNGQMAREHGAPALYCGLGLLHWVDDRDDKSRTAPLLLIPIQAVWLTTGGFGIRQVGEPRMNEELIKHLGLPRAALPDDLLQFKPKKSHRKIRGFSDEAVIGLFSPIRTLLAERLDHALDRSLDPNPLLSRLIQPELRGTDHVRTVEDPPEPFLPCDTSQFEALRAAASGRSIIVNGPPGTGKTQTITNIVAHSLDRKMRVLLLSEAPIALQSVIDRLGKNAAPASILDLRPNSDMPLTASHGTMASIREGLAERPLAELPTLIVATAAGYLAAVPDHLVFDMLIVDEASNMRLSYAIPALTSCRQIIVAGDHQQCTPPPMMRYSPDGSVVDDGDMNLLDAFRAAQFEVVYLNRHYRSKHQSLIEFSNRRFYARRLKISPSKYPLGQYGSILHCVEGIFEDGVNHIEAEKVAQRVVEELKRNDTKSISIIAATYEQCVVIAKLVRKAHPEGYKRVLVMHVSECQGTECDIAYLSLVYGPDAAGSQKFAFGLLSDHGGQRLLNVSLTRAKERTEIFSSIDTETLNSAGRAPANTLVEFLTSHGRTIEDDRREAMNNLLGEVLIRNDYDVQLHDFAVLVRRKATWLAAIQICGRKSVLDEASERAQLENSGWRVLSLAAEVLDRDNASFDPDVLALVECIDGWVREIPELRWRPY